jgi:hypothetical protein
MIDKKKASWTLLVLAALAGFILMTTLAHCAVSGRRGDSSIGNIVYQDNPLTYKAGNLVSYAFVDKEGLVLTIQPIGTYELFDESILICNSPEAGDMLTGKQNPMVLTYKTRARKMVYGLGCHELVRVYEIKTGEAQ